MKSRREFIKTSVMTAGIGLGLDPLILIASPKAHRQAGGPAGQVNADFAWRRTIFCQFDHMGLRAAVEGAAVEGCAAEMNCTVFHGTYPDPDIIAIPAFVMIVDRNIVGHDLWRDYVKYSDHVADSVPCFIVDSIKSLPVPKTNYVYQFDLDKERAIPKMIKTIKQMRAGMDRMLPDLFRTEESGGMFPEPGTGR